MIIGIGSDIIKISRIKALLELKKQRFLNKVFTINEINNLESIANQERLAGYVAKRFAAKEAFVKALGCGIGKQVSFHDIEIVKDDKGKPFFALSAKLTELTRKNQFHLSMSDEREYAIAQVVIEAL